MKGIFINCSVFPFIYYILNGSKTVETRTRNVFKNLIGERVALIRTGKGIPMVYGYATLGTPYRVGRDDSRSRVHAFIACTEYDIKPGKTKLFYPLLDVKSCDPYPVPTDRINHGRSYTEWRD